MFGETSRAAANRQRVPPSEPSGDPDDSSSSEEDEENENEGGNEEEEEEEEEEEQDVFANIAKPPFGLTEEFIRYLDTVVDTLKAYSMKEWDVWCVIKGYTGHAWDEYGGDWLMAGTIPDKPANIPNND
ncbi:hypothetical protein CYMTET_26587 [Cymbomonas tetramitiformis]|uniref:Uncharacterized protein n=1 Tax=Cymbomonas tetramitiformis TaxID=36881 RepID=A0AAE0FS90_9CHLO|nr:hypothetical protein CYMTET_26587 [Cymbomonas tetramitiformis]